MISDFECSISNLLNRYMNKIELQQRTKKFAIEVIKLSEILPSGRAINILMNQLLRSSSSVGANYRSACKGKSTNDL